MAKQLIKRGVVSRQKGKMYYIDGKGDLYSADMKSGRKSTAKKKTATKKKTAKRKPAARKKTAKRKK